MADAGAPGELPWPWNGARACNFFSDASTPGQPVAASQTVDVEATLVDSPKCVV
jgi:hypothetical protein